MSPINLTNKICEIGDVNYEKCSAAYNADEHESTIIANDILSEILENAMDIAINTVNNKKDLEETNMDIIEDIQDDYMVQCPEIKGIIEGLSKINTDKVSRNMPEATPPLEIEVERFLNDMLAPPYQIVNYENLPKKNGVGDQASSIEPYTENADLINQLSKPVEKKSRVTDLVMNSKRALNNMLGEAERKRLDEWEEDNEHILQVIELEKKDAQASKKLSPKSGPRLHEEEEGDIITRVEDESMETIDLNNSKGNDKGGEGDEINKSPLETKEDKSKTSLTQKKKKWNFGFKFFSFKKKSKAETKTEK